MDGLIFLMWWLIAVGIIGILIACARPALRVLHRPPAGPTNPTPLSADHDLEVMIGAI